LPGATPTTLQSQLDLTSIRLIVTIAGIQTGIPCNTRRDLLPVHRHMSGRVRKYLPVLKRINKLSNKAMQDYVWKYDKEFSECISECPKNVI